MIRTWLIATVPAFAIAGLTAAAAYPLGIELPKRTLSLSFSIAAIVVAPPLETGVMIILYFCLGLVIWRSESLRIVALAAILALAHAFDGAWLRAMLVFWPFCVFSIALVAWGRQSYRDAFLVVTGVHALHNATSMAFIALLQSASHAA